MTDNRRIFWNMTATYGRSFFAMVLGLFGSRWVLMALGNSDYGLFGVVGGLIALILFLNGMLGGAVGRFYAVAIGETAGMSPEDGRDHMTKWFNAAVSVHFVLPVLLVATGYPLGLYAIHHWLVIPAERIEACVWVFRFSLAGAFVQMASLPYLSMFTARQKMVEETLWRMLQTLVVFLGAYWLLSWPGDRLIAYAMVLAFVPGVITSVLILRAWQRFSDCRIRPGFLFNRPRLRQIFAFAFWELFASGGDMARAQGTTFLINRSFGPVMNAAWTVGMTVSNHATALSTAMVGAMNPAIATTIGTNDRTRAERLVFCCCKFGALSILVFAVPLVIEMDQALRLWLVNPPEHSAVFCSLMLGAMVVHKLGLGHQMAILSCGKVKGLQFCTGVVSASTLALVWGTIHAGFGAFGVGISFVVSFSALTVLRVAFARKICGLSVRYWLSHVVLPVVLTGGGAFAVGQAVSWLFAPSFGRFALVAATSLSVFLALLFLVACDRDERRILFSKFTLLHSSIRL